MNTKQKRQKRARSCYIHNSKQGEFCYKCSGIGILIVENDGSNNQKIVKCNECKGNGYKNL